MSTPNRRVQLRVAITSAFRPRASWLLGALFAMALFLPAQAAAEATAESRAGWTAEVQQRIRDAEYHITWQVQTNLADVEAAWQAPNRAHGFRTYFTADGIRVISRNEAEPSWDWGLSLIGYGRGDRVRQPAPASLLPDTKRMEYSRENVVEWYVNDSHGLEQGFTLTTPPAEPHRGGSPKSADIPGARRGAGCAAEDGDPVFLALALRGSLRASLSADRQSIDFATPSGLFSKVHYGGLTVRDAIGRELPAWMEVFSEGGVRGIRLVFDDRDAVYPLVVDPLLTSPSWEDEGDQYGAQFGFAVAGVGDVNGDGYSDVLVGAPYYDRGQLDEGRVFLYLGSASGLEAGAAWVAESDQSGARFGCSVAGAGDVDGNGYPDILVGADAYDSDETNEGMVFVYHCSSSGPDDVGNGSCPAGADWCAESNQSEAFLGRAVAGAGDVNDDGYDDILAAAPRYDDTADNQGVTFVYHGSATGLGSSYAQNLKIGNAQGQMGNYPQSVAGAGDVNGDGYDDVILGIPFYGSNDEGYVGVWLGGEDGIDDVVDWTYYHGQDWGHLGWSVAGAGNVNGDGCCEDAPGSGCRYCPERPCVPACAGTWRDCDDIVTGEPGYDLNGNDVGQVRVYLGDPDSTIDNSFAWYTNGSQQDGRYGYAVAGAGDIDGDGYDDIIVGADGYDNGESDEGRVFITLGTEFPSGESRDPDWHAESDNDLALFGAAVAGAGDVNGDGWDDVVIGAPGYTNDKTEEGRAFVYHSAMVSALDLLQQGLGLAPSGYAQNLQPEWKVVDFGSDPNGSILNPAGAVGYGPVPGSIMLSTGTLWDVHEEGPGSTDWGAPGWEYTSFSFHLDVPEGAKTFRFTTQFMTGDTLGRDRANVYFKAWGVESEWSDARLDEIVGTASAIVNPPVSSTIDVENMLADCAGTNPTNCSCFDYPDGCRVLWIEFRLRDGVDGLDDSGLIISNIYFSEEPLPTDITSCIGDPDCPGVDNPDDGVGPYYANPSPSDVSLSAGTYAYSKSLLSVPGYGIPFDFSIFYNSAGVREGSLSRKWTHSYETYAQELTNGPLDGNVIVKMGNGLSEYFEPDGGGGYKPKFDGSSSTLTESAGEFTYTTKDQVTYEFILEGTDPDIRLLDSITNANGQKLQLFYDPDRRLDYVLDTRGEIFTFSYDAEDHVTSVEYPEPGANWATAMLAYHSLTDDLKSITDPNGLTTTFTYDEAGNLLTATNADDVTFVTTRYEEYDGLGVNQIGDRVTLQRNAEPSDPGVTIEYDRDKLVTRNRTDGQEIRIFDVKGRLSRKELFLGRDSSGDACPDPSDPITHPQCWAVTTYAYDVNNNMTLQRDPAGFETTMEYDAFGNMTSKIDPLGNKAMMTYDGRHNLISSLIERSGHVCDPDAPVPADCFIQTYAYDADDNLLTSTDPLGYEIGYTYTTSDGLMETMTDPRGSRFDYEYDSFGSLSSVTDPNLNVAGYTSDLLGRQTSVEDPLFHVTSFTFDTGGRLLTETDHLGNTTSYTYDAEGRVLTATDRLGSVSSREYTPTGMLKRSIDPLLHATEFTYDAEDRLSSVKRPGEQSTTYAYDAAGRLMQVTDPAGGIAAVTYDIVGNQTHVTSPAGRTTAYAHDALGRVTSETDPLDQMIHLAYNERGLVASRTNARGDVITYNYDDSGRLDDAKIGDAVYIDHTLDPNGNIEQSLSVILADVSASYDRLNRPLTRTVDLDSNTSKTIGYEYDAAGNVIKVVYSHADGDWVTYDYDGLNRLWRVTDFDGKVTSYTYDAVGNLKTASLPDGATVTYGYDSAHRLTSMTDVPSDGPAIYGALFTLDANGRRTSVVETLPLEPSMPDAEEDFTYNAGNQLMTREGDAFDYDYDYDDDGNLTGGIIGGSMRSFTYDAVNQLDSIDGVSIRYDASGFRVEIAREGQVTRAVYDPVGRLLAEYDESNTVIARYVYGVGLISRVGAAEGYSFYHFDSRGSTVALTDLDGRITDRYAYAPYGLVTDRTGSTPNPFTYDGRDGVQDDGNGLYFMKSRYYAPELMRFIQKDQVFSGDITDSQSLNRYAYVKGDPIQFVDPDGEWLGSVVGAIVGAAISIGSDVAQGEDICWECAAGAAVEGALVGSGGTLLGAMALGAAGGAAGQFTEQVLKGDGIDLADIGESAAVGALTGGLGHGMGKRAGKVLGDSRQVAKRAASRYVSRAEKKMMRQFLRKARMPRQLDVVVKARIMSNYHLKVILPTATEKAILLGTGRGIFHQAMVEGLEGAVSHLSDGVMSEGYEYCRPRAIEWWNEQN